MDGRARSLVAPAAATILAGGIGGVGLSGGGGATAHSSEAGAHPVVVKGQCDGPARWRLELGPSDDGEGMSGTFAVSGLRPRARWGGALEVTRRTGSGGFVTGIGEMVGRVSQNGRIMVRFGAPSHYRSHVEIGLGTRDGATSCHTQARSRF